MAPACRSGTWRAPARRAACPAIRTARQAPGATYGRHDLRAPVRQFLGAIASCAWPVTAPSRATPALLPSDIARLRPRTRAFASRAADSSRRDLPTRPRPHARRHGGRACSLIRTRLSCRPALPFLLPPFPRPGRVHVLANLDVQRGRPPPMGQAGRGHDDLPMGGRQWQLLHPNPWLPLHGSQLDLADIATRPWARRMIIGTPGLSDETQARARIHELADLAQKFGTLSYPSNAAGFYFPVEIDPTYTAAPADFGAIWSKLPRPCTCRSTTAPASTTRPPRNGWTHSSPGRDHPVPGRRGRTRRDAAAGAGPLRPDPRATPEDRDDRRGLPSESHARRRLLHSATAAEYQAQLQAYAHLDPVHVFDGPNYLDAALIQRIGGVEPPCRRRR